MNKRLLYLGLAAPVLTTLYYAVTLALHYEQLPKSVATHFDIYGEPNDWMPRAVWAAVSLLFLAGILSVYSFVLWKQVQGPVPAFAPLVLAFSYGMLIGAFLEANGIALHRHTFSMLPAFQWGFVLLSCQGLVILYGHRASLALTWRGLAGSGQI